MVQKLVATLYVQGALRGPVSSSINCIPAEGHAECSVYSFRSPSREASVTALGLTLRSFRTLRFRGSCSSKVVVVVTVMLVGPSRVRWLWLWWLAIRVRVVLFSVVDLCLCWYSLLLS